MTVAFLVVAAVWLNEVSWPSDRMPASPALPWYCGPSQPSGDNAARALRDCPQFAQFRADQHALFVRGCMAGLPLTKPIWTGLPDSPPDPTC